MFKIDSLYGFKILSPILIYLLFVVSVASTPIIKSALFNLLKAFNPVIGFVILVPDVFIYIPIEDTCVSSSVSFLVSTSSGTLTCPPTLIVPSVAPAGTSIETFPTVLFKALGPLGVF